MATCTCVTLIMLSLRKAPPLSGAAAALCQGTLRVGLLRGCAMATCTCVTLNTAEPSQGSSAFWGCCGLVPRHSQGGAAARCAMATCMCVTLRSCFFAATCQDFLLVSFNFVVYTHDAHTHTHTHRHKRTHTHTARPCRKDAGRAHRGSRTAVVYCMWNGVSSLCCFLSPRLSPLIFVLRSPYQVSNRVSRTACTIPDESERFC